MINRMQDFSENFSALIIEDNLGDFILIEDYLQEKFEKITLVHCQDYTTSVDYMKNSKEKFSVILLDLNLPDLGGIELINSVLAKSAQVPIIILTGYSDLAMAKSSLQIGVYDYLVKDEINPDILFRTIIFSLNRSSFINQIEAEKLNYENLFNFNPQPTWLLNLESFKIIHANIAAQKKYGYSLDDFLKISFTKLHPLGEELLIVNKFNSTEDEESKNHFTHLLSNGQEIKVEIYFKEIQSNLDRGLIVQSNDISETLTRINTIEVQNEKLRSIAWTQSHVVRAPLSRILGIVNLIEQKTDNLEEILYWVKQLRISTEEMDTIVKKIINETNSLKEN
jgi:DNA-binding NarL/FixJ family response regulator